MQKRWTAIFVLVCMLLGMLGCSPVALAESKTVYVASNTLKVYQKASSSSKTLGTMSYGEKMTCTAVDGSWAQVKNSDGDVGYCKKSSLTTDNPNTLDEKVYLSKTGVKVYEKPSTSSDVMMKVTESNLDDSYTAVARTKDGDWYRLKNGKYYGYVRDKYVVFAKDKEEKEDKESEKELSETVYIKKATLKIYNKASSSGKVLGTMGYGEQLTRMDVDGSWAKVKNSGGDVGYCKNSSLTEKNPNNKELAIYAKKDGVKVYQLPDDDSDVVAKLSKDDKMILVAEVSSSWDRVKVSGEYGYVLSKNTTDEAPEIPEDEPEDEPEVEPEEPKDDPEDEPEVDPEEPKDDPEDEPEVDPEEPKDDPEDEPEVDPEEPKDESKDESKDEPEVDPEEPKDESKDEPEVDPEEPKDESKDEPEVDPEEPKDDPEDEPEVEPEEPKDEPEDEPEVDPEEPKDEPEDEPEVDPEEPKDDPEDETKDEPEQPEEDAEEKPSGSIAEQIVALAKQQLGDPYVYAAHGPDRFDCSGLIYYCYLEIAGIKLPRTAYSQGYDDNYQKISDPGDLKLGDLVFFNTNTKDSDLSDHSGIYIGGGKFVHASSSAAKVITSDLSSGYYAGAFSWGRRVL